jgi:C-terminal processing protease CtpA/Prc
MVDRKLSNASASVMLPKLEGFDNIEYYLRITGTTQWDKRVMTFVDNLWGFEVTGGRDQFEYLTIISVKRSGLARRAGMRVGDKISSINDVNADKLTLKEAQQMISESGRYVKIVVRG